ncbi:arginase [Consotaella aegiceratis]|uniref:arginase n=1 Tax=Consotaella aegiceratis TaxID=3097961 RepID=UPI002F3ED74E
MHCKLIGVPLEAGAAQLGCGMGPAALRIARLGEALRDLGHNVSDCGDLAVPSVEPRSHPNGALRNLGSVAEWTRLVGETAYRESAAGMPIFLGGDHALSAGTVTGLARRAAELGRPLFVLWLDAHTDFHSLETTRSGNLHGVPVAYFTGRPAFAPHFPEVTAPVDPARVCMIGIRSVDPAERDALRRTEIVIHDMRAIDEHGVAALLRGFLAEVEAAQGLLHVSFDVDCLDPSLGPGVGTTVPGGLSFREAHLVMEMLHDSGLVTSLDLVELNPFLDERGRTAILLVELTASLMGRTVMDRPTRSFG